MHLPAFCTANRLPLKLRVIQLSAIAASRIKKNFFTHRCGSSVSLWTLPPGTLRYTSSKSWKPSATTVKQMLAFFMTSYSKEEHLCHRASTASPFLCYTRSPPTLRLCAWCWEWSIGRPSDTRPRMLLLNSQIIFKYKDIVALHIMNGYVMFAKLLRMVRGFYYHP